MKILMYFFTIVTTLLFMVNIVYNERKRAYTNEISKQWYICNEGKLDYIKKDTGDAINHVKKGVDINVSEVWASNLNYKNDIVIAVVDSGVNYKHEDLANKMWINLDEIDGDGIDNDNNGYIDDIYGWNFCNSSNELMSGEDTNENNHGTIIAGIIAGNHDGKGIAGIAGCCNVKIMNCKILESLFLEGTIDNLISAIQYAEKNGAQICNLSLTVDDNNKKLRNIMKDSEMLFVVSVGNDGKNIDECKEYPACFGLDNVITVANMSYDGELDVLSNYGAKSVDIAAPGNYIYSTCVEGYDYDSGSSMSAAIVSGVAALLYSLNNDATPEKVKTAILQGAKEYASLSGKVNNERFIDAYEAINKY